MSKCKCTNLFSKLFYSSIWTHFKERRWKGKERKGNERRCLQLTTSSSRPRRRRRRRRRDCALSPLHTKRERGGGALRRTLLRTVLFTSLQFSARPSRPPPQCSSPVLLTALCVTRPQTSSWRPVGTGTGTGSGSGSGSGFALTDLDLQLSPTKFCMLLQHRSALRCGVVR